MATRGRSKTTGRYTTRVELCREVWFWYTKTELGITGVAKLCRVSPTTVSNILDTKEGYPEHLNNHVE